MTTNLDHATARIITELADALLPGLKEAVAAELARTIESLPAVDRELEETLSSLRRLRALSEEMTAALNSAQDSALRVSDGLLPLSRMCETMNAAIDRLERLEQLAPKPEEPDENHAAASGEILRSLEANLSDWGGILKANGRAQTRELSEFSAEVSEQVGWMKSGMPGMVGEILEKTLSSRIEEQTRTTGENARALEARLSRLEKTGKIILAEGLVLLAFLAAIAAALLK
ncbi:MAG: hypothetical protein FWG71_11540 [Synergistaceae bacterium]|nr:hypothetical protein [Synergistaceae bacterium]